MKNNKKNISKSNEKKNVKNNIIRNENKIYIIAALTLTVAIIVCFIFFDPLNIIKKDLDDETSFTNIIIDKPIINYTEGQLIDLQDLNISWQECNNAAYYIYKVITLAGQPEYGNDNEGARQGSFVVSENLQSSNERVINISKEKLQEGKWVKIAVAACNDEEQVWSTTYVYINLSGNIKNTAVNIQYGSVVPVIDGIVNAEEYGNKVHSVDYTKEEFIDVYDADHSIKADFYMTWDIENLYFAWVVNTDGHWPVPDCNSDGNVGTPSDIKNMWQYSSIQFMLSTGAPDVSKPTYQTSQWAGNYLEAGIAIMEDGTSSKFLWSVPGNIQGFVIDDFSFKGIRDEQKKTTTYEVKIPWEKLGMNDIGKNQKFGFSYAISDQNDFNADPNMLEWQDAILGIKNMDAGAIIELK